MSACLDLVIALRQPLAAQQPLAQAEQPAAPWPKLWRFFPMNYQSTIRNFTDRR